MHTATVTATMRRVMRGGMIGLVAALLLAALALVPPAATVRAAGTTYIVTTTLDNASDANCTVASCTLRQAVNASNANDPGAGNANTITFAATANGTITLTNANGFRSLMPTQNVTIDATVGTRTVTIDGVRGVKLFRVASGVTLGLSGLTLTRGSTGVGGAIYNTGGTVAITGSTLSGNTVTADDGGAIYNIGGTVTITNSTLSNNNAHSGSGGAIANFSNSTVSGTVGGTVTITGSTLSGNSATYGGVFGGAIYNDLSSTVTITNSTLSGNTAAYGGGAIANDGGTVTVTGSTLSGNSATYGGGGGAIYTGGTFTLTLAVVAGNTAPSGPGPDINGTVTTDGGGNVVGDTSGSSGLTHSTDKLNADPLLAPALANNGGTVQTFALLPGSPAIDLLACPIDPISGTTLVVDARGVSRPQPVGGKCDAGSYEARAFTLGTLTGNGQQQAVNRDFPTPLGLTVTGTMSDPVAGGHVTFTIIPGGNGASATFATATGCTNTSSTVTVCTIGASGTTATPPLTANGTLGTFTVIASTAGAASVTFTRIIAAPNATPAAAPTGVPSGLMPATAPPAHTPGAGSGAGTPAPLPQPVRH